MNWKREKPKENGYYWVLRVDSDIPNLVLVKNLVVYYIGNDTPFMIETKKEYRENKFHGSYWIGPLIIPEKP